MRPVRESLREYARGIVGGLIFSLPLLFTMEVWWAGIELDSQKMLQLVLLTFLILLGYNNYAGVRPSETKAGIFIDSVEEFGLGLVVSAGALTLLGRIEPSDPLREAVGKIVLEALLVAIGISIGTAQITNEGDEDAGPGRKPESFLGILVVSVCGAVILATNIAVTEEVIVLALESSSWRLVGMVLVSLVVAAVILVFSDLLQQRERGAHPAEWKSLLSGVTLSYVVAFAVSALLLYLFGRFEGVALTPCLGMVVVLSTAAVLGSAAGKIVL